MNILSRQTGKINQERKVWTMTLWGMKMNDWITIVIGFPLLCLGFVAHRIVMLVGLGWLISKGFSERPKFLK